MKRNLIFGIAEAILVISAFIATMILLFIGEYIIALSIMVSCGFGAFLLFFSALAFADIKQYIEEKDYHKEK